MDPDEEQAIGVAKLNATLHLEPHDDKLLPQNRILGFEPALRLEERRHEVQGQKD
jgi:hypothetical protein